MGKTDVRQIDTLSVSLTVEVHRDHANASLPYFVIKTTTNHKLQKQTPHLGYDELARIAEHVTGEEDTVDTFASQIAAMLDEYITELRDTRDRRLEQLADVQDRVQFIDRSRSAR